MNVQNLSPQLQYLVDTSKPFDQQKLTTLDQLTQAMVSGKQNYQEMEVTNKIWSSFKEDESFWLNTHFIMSNSQVQYTKIYTLITLEDAIKKRWNTFPQQQQEGLKKYIVDMMIADGSKADLTKEQQNQLSICNSILIQILKYEWDTTWQSFIPDICTASKSNENLCKNNLKLLRMLSEEIFDYSKNSLTSQKKGEMKKKFESQFQVVFELCQFIAQAFIKSPKEVGEELMKENLETLYSFLSWIPIVYIYMTDLIEILIEIIQHNNLRVAGVKCLTEIVILPIEDNNPEKAKIQQRVYQLYSQVLGKIQGIIPFDHNLQIERERISRSSRDLVNFEENCQALSMYFTGFFSTHLNWVQSMINDCNNDNKGQLMEEIRKGLVYLVHFTSLKEEDNIFKICTEFWTTFTDSLVKDPLVKERTGALLNMSGNYQNYNLQQNIYPAILTQVRKQIIYKMARPKEVLIKVEDGDVVKEEVKDTENQSMYQTLKQLMINLTKLDEEVTQQILVDKFDKLMDGSEWSWDNCNSLCWAVGSISGTLNEMKEKFFLIGVIRVLLNLCDVKRGKENKAIIASNIMHVVGSYPQFLKANWSFLRTVVKKLFEFMKEPFPGVMEMAVNTFLEISKTCKEEFVKVQQDPNIKQAEKYIYEMLRTLQEETRLLEPNNLLVVYEALGFIISAEQNNEEQQIMILNLIEKFYENPVQILNPQNPGDIKDKLQKINQILRITERIASSSGYCFAVVLEKILGQLVEIYKTVSLEIIQKVQNEGKKVLNFFEIKLLKKIKTEVLKIMSSFLKHCHNKNPQCNIGLVIKNFILPFQEIILSDYIESDPDVRDPQLLHIYTIIFENIATQIGQLGLVPNILKGIFDPTLPMIQNDYNSHPDIREKFFYFLQAVVNNAIEALFNTPEQQFQNVIDCVIWATKHHLNNLSQLGLDVLLFILKNVNQNSYIANQFYRAYYMYIFKAILEIITDGYHKSGFGTQYQIFAILIQIIKNNLITESVDVQNQGTLNNQQFIQQFLIQGLTSTFQTISKQQTEQFVYNIFQTCDNLQQFKVTLRDYLINLQSYSKDFEHMYDDKEIAQQNKQQNQQ
ncbi:Armadillo-type fold [Pseudocohnilembus persalinus]|uniref:Exportin-1 n=1 Tax=Pseudocohnilembus persalinus TaxID=266149 RepID=A0A0V0QGX4_PSEPJ|nr:Armadillo-type fold [Pseudocohnilembus persalinus]|eukprot:KRX01384.1 Armadillo-type fold [Pseudocohnilembus persalinus]